MYKSIGWIWSQDTTLTYDVYEFSTGPGPLTGMRKLNTTPPLSRDAAVTFLRGYTGPVSDDASTPLADAYCRLVQQLKDNFVRESSQDDLFLRLLSDGEENSSFEPDCDGRDSDRSYNEITPGTITIVPEPITTDGRVNDLLWPSWEAYILDKAITGKAHKLGDTDLAQAFKFNPLNPKVITNTVFIEPGFISTASALRTTSADAPTVGVDRPSTRTMALRSSSLTGSTAASPSDGFFGLLSAMSKFSGGRATRLDSVSRPGSDPAGSHAVAGDADDNGCVNGADLTFVQQRYGKQASEANPGSFAADVTLDGKVNSLDYNLVLRNWGNGCQTSPGPIPPTAGVVVLGFETLDRTSAQAPLSLTTSPRNEGKRALAVGSSGYREMVSRNLDTATLGTITSKMAYDVYVPRNPSSPYWIGQTQLLVNIPSAGIHNRFIGSFDLAGRPLGAFTSVQFNLPAAVVSALRASRQDVSFKIVINASPFGENFALDNLRFVP